MDLGKETDTVMGFKKFVSADELEEARKKKQEEWEKVRKPDDPEGIQLLTDNCVESFFFNIVCIVSSQHCVINFFIKIH